MLRTRHFADRDGTTAGSIRCVTSAPIAIASPHLPKSTAMTTKSFMPSKKGCLITRDTFSLNSETPVTKTNFQLSDSLVVPLSGFHSLQYPNSNRHRLSANSRQILTLRRNQHINPQVRSPSKAV